MLDNESLRTFMVVADEGSFSQAAKKLNKTSAAIGYRIKSLETKLGLELIKRTTRSITLTKEGEHLKNRCRQIFALFESVPQELDDISKGVEHEFSLVVNKLLYDDVIVSRLIAYLTTEYPHTCFKVYRETYMGVWEALEADRCDLAIGAPGMHPMGTQFQTLALGNINWLFVMAPGHPLNRMTGILPDSALERFPAVNFEDTSTERKKSKAWLLPGQKEIIVPDLKTKLRCHLEGVGVGFLPETLCAPYLRAGRLITRRVSNPRLCSPMSLAWRESHKGVIANDLIEMFTRKDPGIQGFIENIDHKTI